jgi:hypothetical protein
MEGVDTTSVLEICPMLSVFISSRWANTDGPWKGPEQLPKPEIEVPTWEEYGRNPVLVLEARHCHGNQCSGDHHVI